MDFHLLGFMQLLVELTAERQNHKGIEGDIPKLAGSKAIAPVAGLFGLVQLSLQIVSDADARLLLGRSPMIWQASIVSHHLQSGRMPAAIRKVASNNRLCPTRVRLGLRTKMRSQSMAGWPMTATSTIRVVLLSAPVS